MKMIIVSRHPAAITFIAKELNGVILPGATHVRIYTHPDTRVDIPVLAQATLTDVAEAVVYGNVPLHLACKAIAVVAIEFSGEPPRGAEYSIEDMYAAGAHLRAYQISAGPQVDIPLDDSQLIGGIVLGGILQKNPIKQDFSGLIHYYHLDGSGPYHSGSESPDIIVTRRQNRNPDFN